MNRHWGPDRERREQFDREQRALDRTWRIALVIGVLGAAVSIALGAGVAVWIWSVIQ